MPDVTISFAQETFRPDASGALYWPDREMLIVSDLHFEKGSSFAQKGVFLPPYDTRATLTMIEDLCRRFAPKTILSLGDAFHDTDAQSRMEKTDRDRLGKLCARHRWIWVLGNHDPEPPEALGDEAVEEIKFGPIEFRHEASPLDHPIDGAEMSGHYHPAALIRTEGRTLRRRCFVHDDQRMILPAMGAFTGGLNILDPAVKVLFKGQINAFALGKSAVYPMPLENLVPERHRPSVTSRRKNSLSALKATG